MAKSKPDRPSNSEAISQTITSDERRRSPRQHGETVHFNRNTIWIWFRVPMINGINRGRSVVLVVVHSGQPQHYGNQLLLKCLSHFFVLFAIIIVVNVQCWDGLIVPRTWIKCHLLLPVCVHTFCRWHIHFIVSPPRTHTHTHLQQKPENFSKGLMRNSMLYQRHGNIPKTAKVLTGIIMDKLCLVARWLIWLWRTPASPPRVTNIDRCEWHCDIIFMKLVNRVVCVA